MITYCLHSMAHLTIDRCQVVRDRVQHAACIITREHDADERRRLTLAFHIGIIVMGITFAVILATLGANPMLTGACAFTPNILQEIADVIGKLR